MANSLGEEDPGLPLGYDIPPGAGKVGPVTGRDPDLEWYNYTEPGAKNSLENVIGRECYFKGQLIERELFKRPTSVRFGGYSSIKHGVQQTWHRNGVKASESPYKNGKMDGVFREWNDAGQLIGHYKMADGTGTKRIYNADGTLQKEEHFETGRRDGTFFEAGSTQVTLLWAREGHVIGKAFSFDATGEVRSIICYSSEGIPHGPGLSFSQSGTVITKEWYVKERAVTESQYQVAASIDPTLPPYYADARKYKEFATPEVKALLKKYLNLPRVKIPLEFDKAGNPILAQPLR